MAAYKQYSQGKQTLNELSHKMGLSVRYIWQLFDELSISPVFAQAPKVALNLVIDATFFGRYDGIMVFRANRQNLYWRFINTETVEEVAIGLDWLEAQGFKFSSITVDGKRGVISYLTRRYPTMPIQFCQFHQAQIVRRYLTLNPRTPCGKYLQAIMRCLTETEQAVFASLVETAAQWYDDFLKERNDQGQFKHRKLRSAFRSLRANMPFLFSYKAHPELNIPNTTNSCDGSFAHWKQKVKIHHGLKKHRRHKMINFLLGRGNLS